MINIYKRCKNKYKFSHHIDNNEFASITVFLGKNSSINDIAVRPHHYEVYIKIGDNSTIRDLELLYSPQNSKYYIKIGSNCTFGNFVKLTGNISVSDHVSVGNNTYIYQNVKIHPHVKVDSTVTLSENVVLRNNAYVKFGSIIQKNSIIRPYDVVVNSTSTKSTYYYDEYIKDFRFIGEKNRNLIRKYHDLRAKQKQMESS